MFSSGVSTCLISCLPSVTAYPPPAGMIFRRLSVWATNGGGRLSVTMSTRRIILQRNHRRRRLTRFCRAYTLPARAYETLCLLLRYRMAFAVDEESGDSRATARSGA